MEPLAPKKRSGLGSLAQSARGKHLNQAKWLLIVVGVLTLIVNGIQVAMARDLVKGQLDVEIQKRGIGHQIDRVQLKEIEDQGVRMVYLLGGALIAIGVLFVVFGLIIKMFPVPVTVTSLVIYVGAAAVFAVIDPATIVQGIIWKIIVVVCLAKAIQAAIAYQKEQKELEQAEPTYEPEIL